MSSREEKVVICIAIAICALFLGMYVFSNVSDLEDLSSTYLLVNGSRPLTGNWNAGNYNISLNELTLGVANNNYSFPVSDGQTNEVLISDGNGTLNFGILPTPGTFIFYLHNETSDIAGNYNMTVQLPYTVTQNFPFAAVVDDQILLNFTTVNGYPSINLLPEGLTTLHIHANRTKTGTATGRLYYEIYRRNAVGTEVLLTTSMLSNILTTDSMYENILATLNNATIFDLTDRITVSIRVMKEGVGTLNVELQICGDTSAHFAIPAPSISAANFVPYMGATQDVDLDTWDISATNFVFPNEDIAVPSAEIYSHARYPLNSNGNNFTTVQAAVNDLSGVGWVYVPNGTWSESVSITNTNIILFGGGWSSVIDGGTIGHAINVDANFVFILDLQVKTDQGQGNAYDGVHIDTGGGSCKIVRVFVGSSDRYGFYTDDFNEVYGCFIQNTDDDGAYFFRRTFFHDNRITNSGDNNIELSTAADASIIAVNELIISGDDSIYIPSTTENCIAMGNIMFGWTNEAIDDNSGTSRIVGNINSHNMIPTTFRFQFRDPQIYIASLDNGRLDVEADISIDLNAPVDVGGSFLGWGDGIFDIGSGTSDDVNVIYYHTLSQHSDREEKENIVLLEINRDSNIELPEVYYFNWKEKIYTENVTYQQKIVDKYGNVSYETRWRLENIIIPASGLTYGFLADEINDTKLSSTESGYDPISLLAKSIAKIQELEKRIEYLEQLILSPIK